MRPHSLSAKKWTTADTGIVFTWFLCNPCYSSTNLRDKLKCQLVPCSTRLDCDRHEVVRLSQICLFCCFLCCRSVSRCCRSRRRVTNVRVSKCVWYGNVLRHGICVAPSGILPSDLDKPTGSLTAGYCAFFTDLQMISFICACRICLGTLFLHDKPCRPCASTIEPCRPCASTIEPQRQLWGWHVLLPRRKSTAIRMSSSDSRSPIAVMGGMCSQSPACSVAAAFNLAISVAVFVSSTKIFWQTVAATGVLLSLLLLLLI